jgi:hypothetical protein
MKTKIKKAIVKITKTIVFAVAAVACVIMDEIEKEIDKK